MSVRTLILALAQFALITRAAFAESILIDLQNGALFDAIVDGFPGQFAFDGEPDLGGNQLGTALRRNVTEERGIAEFPLSSLAGSGADAIEQATLTFNIDDVLSTFGPGTDFAGRAAHTIILFVYAGDGTITLADYKNIAGDPHVIDTTSLGTITDNSLRSSGPIVFHVDLTADIRHLIEIGAPSAGIVWTTTDSPTGTSLDDLGDGSAGPAGVGGARLPFLTIELAAAPPPTLTLTPTSEPTPIPPTATSSATATATATVGEPSACIGDCGVDGNVTVDELVGMIRIALDGGGTSTCASGDPDGSDDITVDEIVRAVVAALNGCD